MNTVEVVKNLLLRSGTEWVLWLLLALSVASLAVAIERFLHFRKKDEDLEALAKTLEDALTSGGLEAGTNAIRDRASVSAVVARAGLSLAHRGAAAADRAMQRAIAVQRSHLEARLAFLGTLGNNAPFIGLFGTVIGVISAFEELGRAPAGAAGAAASQVASSAVMSAIAEALVATAVGIAVALPAVVFYNYFQRAIDRLVEEASVIETVVIEHVHARHADADARKEAA